MLAEMFNLNAKEYYPVGEKERIENENAFFTKKENEWWLKNQSMFEDSFEDELYIMNDFKIKNLKIKNINKLKFKKTILSTTWANIVKG